MRVIAGTARGTKLRSPSTTETVPITDRAKEALFNILYPITRDSRFLDMFAGTGGVGIEALSRGAKHATFVEISDKIFEDLKWNIDRTRCKERATLINTDAFEYVVKSKEKFDIIFVAPPQWVGMCQKAMDSLSARTDLLEDDGIIITQHNPAEEVVVDDKIFTEYDKRIYGGVQFNFYRKSRN